MRSTGSKEARQYGIKESCVMVNGTVRLVTEFEEKVLEEVIINNINNQ